VEIVRLESREPFIAQATGSSTTATSRSSCCAAARPPYPDPDTMITAPAAPPG